jgi:hypothetical protein
VSRPKSEVRSPKAIRNPNSPARTELLAEKWRVKNGWEKGIQTS